MSCTVNIRELRIHNEYDDEHQEVFIIFWTNFCDSAHVEWLLDPCSKKKLLQSVTNEPDELKL